MTARSLLSVCLLSALPMLARTAPAQGDPLLLGRWIGNNEENQGETLTIEKDVFLLGELRLPYKTMGPGVLVFGGDDGGRADYKIAGDILTLSMEGELALPLPHKRAWPITDRWPWYPSGGSRRPCHRDG